MNEPVGSVVRARSYVAVAAALWSLSGVLAKGIDLAPTTIAFYRSLFAGLVLLPMVPRRRWAFRPGMAPGALAFAAMIGLYISAVKATTAANAIFLQCTASVWLVPVSVLFLRERIDRRVIVSLLLIVVGCLLIVALGPNRPDEMRGNVLALASGVAFAGVILGLRYYRGLDPIWLSAFNNLAGALGLGAWILLTMGLPPVPSMRELGYLATFGVIQMAIPYAFFARGLRVLPAPEAGLIALLEPVLNPIWVLLVCHEWPAMTTIWGGGLILFGLAIRYVPGQTGQRQAAASVRESDG